MVMLDAAPLLTLGTPQDVGRTLALAEGLRIENGRRVLYNIMRRGKVGIFTADRICTACGHHPAEVYGADWPE